MPQFRRGLIPTDAQGRPYAGALIWSRIVNLISHNKMHLSWGGNNAFVLVLAPSIALSPYSHAAAGSLDMRFDHHVVITKGSDGHDSPKIDDREVLKNYYVDIDETHVVDGVGVAVGTSSEADMRGRDRR